MRILTIILLCFLLILIARTANGAWIASLEISTQEQCEILGGVWNSCPPNECQKSEAFQKGEILCADVCDSPQCEGIVPEEEQNLSEIHNPTIYESNANRDRSDELKNTAQNTDEQKPVIAKQKTINNTYLILYLILSIVLLFVFILIKNKQKNETR